MRSPHKMVSRPNMQTQCDVNFRFSKMTYVVYDHDYKDVVDVVMRAQQNYFFKFRKKMMVWAKISTRQRRERFYQIEISLMAL